MADNSGILNQFFGGAKTIQKAYDFFVEFGDEYPNLKLFHVKNVQIPQGSFKAENQMLGAFSKLMPIFDSTNHFELRITLEEDEYSNVQNAIFLMRNKMMNPDTGYVNLTYDNLGPKVVPSVFAINVALKAPGFSNGVGTDATQKRFYTFKDCYLIGVQEPTFDYTSNTIIDFTLTFSCQYMEFENRNDSTPGSVYGITQEPAPVMVTSNRNYRAPTVDTAYIKNNKKQAKREKKEAEKVRTDSYKEIQSRTVKLGVEAVTNVNNERAKFNKAVKEIERVDMLGVAKLPPVVVTEPQEYNIKPPKYQFGPLANAIEKDKKLNNAYGSAGSGVSLLKDGSPVGGDAKAKPIELKKPTSREAASTYKTPAQIAAENRKNKNKD